MPIAEDKSPSILFRYAQNFLLMFKSEVQNYYNRQTTEGARIFLKFSKTVLKKEILENYRLKNPKSCINEKNFFKNKNFYKKYGKNQKKDLIFLRKVFYN